MNLKVICPSTAGIFSRFSRAIQGIIYHVDIDTLKKVENIYFEPESEKINKYNFVMNQKLDPNLMTHTVVTGKHFITWNNGHNDIIRDKKFYNYEKLNLLKQKIKFSQKIKGENYFCDESTLGIHIRITDMNVLHPQNTKGISVDSYLNIINQTRINFKNIFIASDNHNSIQYLTNLLYKEHKLFYNASDFIAEHEYDSSLYNIQINEMENKFFWIQAFKDMYSLSRCDCLIHGVSNLNNVSFLFSDSIKHSHLVK